MDYVSKNWGSRDPRWNTPANEASVHLLAELELNGSIKKVLHRENGST